MRRSTAGALVAILQQQKFFIELHAWHMLRGAWDAGEGYAGLCATRLGVDLARCIALRLRAMVYVGVSWPLLTHELRLCSRALAAYFRLLLPGRRGRKLWKRAMRLRTVLSFSYGYH